MQVTSYHMLLCNHRKVAFAHAYPELQGAGAG